MRKKLWLVTAVLTVMIIQSFIFLGSGSALGVSGLKVSPSIIQATIPAGQDSLTINETVTNTTAETLVVNIHPQDFGSLGQTETPNFYGPNYNPATNPHGLQNSVQLNASQITLAPNAAQVVAVSIDNANQLASGGHYGAVIYSPEDVATLPGTNNVKFAPAIASLIFLATAGSGTQELHISNISEGKLAFSLPSSLSFVVANSGNTQSTPIGYMKLVGPNNKLLAQNIINPNSDLVLPDSSILTTVNLHVNTTLFSRSGRYKMVIVYGYSGGGSLKSVTSSMIFINVPQILLIIVVVVGLIWVIRLRQKYRRNHPKPKKVVVDHLHDFRNV
jgi:hypothetical protein